MFLSGKKRASVALVAAGMGLCGAAGAQEFHYSGDSGPAHWAELNTAWEACAGTEPTARQSPIDITRFSFDRSLRRLDVTTYPTTIDIFNNGHTIEQHYEDTGSSIRFEGAEYELQQFHFHTLSEHTVGGEHGVMEMHAVFSSGSANLVIGVMYELGWYVNPFIQKLIDAGLPVQNGDTTEIDDLIDVKEGFTDTSYYYTYPGSLTTPGCSETVTWVVLGKTARLSRNQLDAFRDILGNNFRPTQALNGRVVRVSKPGHSYSPF